MVNDMDAEQLKTDAHEFDTQYSAYIHNETALPDVLAAKYDLVTCLASAEHADTYEAKSKTDGKRYILKIMYSQNRQVRREDDILKELDHPHIPKLIESMQENGTLYIVREFFEGRTLSAAIASGRRFTDAETVDIAKKLCDILSYLHDRPQPVIYRDLKPQNIIISQDGDIKLVDFDIARKYDAAVGSDTQYYGTKEYAAPEQFGYAQTDARTDIYALGVLMMYMLTRSWDLNNINAIKNKQLKTIATACTQFAPKDRYPSIKTLKKQLMRAQKMSLGRRLKRMTATGVLCVVCLAAGFFAGLYYHEAGQPSANVYSANAVVTFESTLIDQAVRLALGKTTDDPIYYYELAEVESIRIWGGDIYRNDQPLILGYDAGFTDVRVFFGGYDSDSQPVERGDISSLEEIALLKNLKQLELVMQNVTDLSPLVGLPLERVNIAGNQVSDLSPLSDTGTLVYLNIDYNPVVDISPLMSKTYLIELSASDTLIEDVSPLRALYHMEYLYLNNARIKDVSPLANLDLTNCFLENNQITDVSMVTASGNLSTTGNPIE